MGKSTGADELAMLGPGPVASRADPRGLAFTADAVLSAAPGKLRVKAGLDVLNAKRPKSASRGWAGGLGVVGFAVGLAVMPGFSLDPVAQALVLLAAVAAPMLLVELVFLKVYRRRSTGLDWSRAPDFSLSRTAVKLAGLAGTLGSIGFIYWLLPEYGNPVFKLFFDFVAAVFPYLVVPSILYIYVVDAYMTDPRDGYWHAGRFFLGHSAETNRGLLWQYALGWLVKGFFIPLMLPEAGRNIAQIYGSIFFHGAPGFLPFFDCAWTTIFTVDVTFASIGYMLCLRIADTHIRSTEPTLQGWLIALICYAPFWSVFDSHYLGYGAASPYWASLFYRHPDLQIAWGGTILCLAAVYVWATVSFGCRFSNLTHRGIITNGPYRWSKHPAYIAKNLSWWMVSVPFASKLGMAGSVQMCLLLGIVNLIYFLRARTEERHLSRDPDYVAYALWMDQHGLLRPLAGVFPFLRYRPPRRTRDLPARQVG